jgi:hypothetical protein
MIAHSSDHNIPNLERALHEAKSLWDLIAHDRVKDRLEKIFFHLSFGRVFGVGRGDTHREYSAVASRVQHSSSKLASRELEEAVFRLENAAIQKAFEIYEDETLQRRITNVQLLWLVYNLGLVPYIETEVLRDICFRLDKAQPSLGFNLYRVHAEQFFVYRSVELRKEFPVVIRIIDALKAQWRDKLNDRMHDMIAQPAAADIPGIHSHTASDSGRQIRENQPRSTASSSNPETTPTSESHAESIAGVQESTLTTAAGQHEHGREVPDSGTPSLEAQEKRDASPARSEVPLPPIAMGNGEWEDIEICFLSDDRVQIHMGKMRPTLNYAEFGFQDNRTENPNGAWKALIRFAEQDGLIKDGAQANLPWKKFEKRVQEIRYVFRKHFGIPSDPIPYVEGIGYRARFKIRCGRSFHS